MKGVTLTLNRAVAMILELKSQYDTEETGYITKADFIAYLMTNGHGTDRSSVRDLIAKFKILGFLREDYVTEKLFFTYENSKMYENWKKQKGLGGFLND